MDNLHFTAPKETIICTTGALTLVVWTLADRLKLYKKIKKLVSLPCPLKGTVV
jgi:hypothetical protein